MVTSDNSRAGYALHADLQNSALRMAEMPDMAAVGAAQNAPAIAYDADGIVGELVRQYLQCSNSISGIFCF